MITAAISPLRPESPTDRLASFANEATFEVLPHNVRPENYPRLKDKTVFVAALPDYSYDDTLQCAINLKQAGAHPVPHFPVRRFKDSAEMTALLARFKEHGITRVLLIAGDNEHAGQFASTLKLLDAKLFESYGITEIFVAGHPEGNPNASAQDTRSALQIKNIWAQNADITCRIANQVCFDNAAMREWTAQLEEDDISLPLSAGIYGPTSIRQLFKLAKQLKVKTTWRMAFKKHAVTLLRAAKKQDASGLIASLLTNERVDGLHYFCFGSLNAALDYNEQLKNPSSPQTQRILKLIARTALKQRIAGYLHLNQA
jgi:methylenetetrahydrofolate reductase (NADPH)